MKYLKNIVSSLVLMFTLLFAFSFTQPAYAFTCEAQARILEAIVVGKEGGLSKNVVFTILLEKGLTSEQARILVDSVYDDMTTLSPKQAYHMFLSYCLGA